jgi:hypothetical protein
VQRPPQIDEALAIENLKQQLLGQMLHGAGNMLAQAERNGANVLDMDRLYGVIIECHGKAVAFLTEKREEARKPKIAIA